jgi:hypothetical protein
MGSIGKDTLITGEPKRYEKIVEKDGKYFKLIWLDDDSEYMPILRELKKVHKKKKKAINVDLDKKDFII